MTGIYAVVLVGATSGQIVVRPEGTDAGMTQLTVNSLVATAAGQRVVLAFLDTPGATPVALGVVL